jgi:heptosyltransferase-2
MRLNEGMEALIRKSPENWFWLHQRWKTPSPKFLLSTYRRGVFVPEHIRLKPFRILIRSVNWLGDCVMTVPAVQAIKKGRPDAHVTILCAAKLAEFWRLLPEVDEVLVFEPGDTVFKVARKVRAGRFDVAVLFPNSLRSALEVSTVPRRVGFAGHSRRRLLNQIVPKLSERKKNPILRPVHQVNHYLAIAERIGARLEWDFPPELRDLPVNESTSPHPRILVCPGAEYGPAKRWLPERFAAVITEVSRRRECGWFLVGTSRDREITAEIAGKAEGNVTDLAGKTSLTELMIHLRSADLLLTNDTGTMHLASMLGTPVLAIFGSTEPVLTGPMGEKSVVLRHQVECSPCFLRTCPLDFRCMKAVEVDEVVEAVIRATDAPPVHTAAGAKN